MAKRQRKTQLSDLQLAVMRVLWSRGEATTADVVADLAAERGLAHTTVATLLTRLEKRGVVAQRRDGRTWIYSASMSETEVQRSMVADLVASLFGGDRTALVAHLVSTDEVSSGDLAAVRARLRAARTANRPPETPETPQTPDTSEIADV
ncbi:MAG: BlaI/MecI/CopY family transcriptional regulator [Thermoanaerobaculia bacterium]|jgi:predicted transcriptional regulator|nr:BlaI/MecI/CopY family transcriptional regulator [Thermoanaerobaculia bacterium]MBP9825631.1 BlaI/MecI/CopY family transcriptional regulator [Thermoanaerobaculia bacterium]